jgi:transcriptional regulator with XRE-family HTH domain
VAPQKVDPGEARFAAELKSERTRAGLSQDALGELVGLTGTRISQFESGDVPAPDLVFRLEAVLDLPPGRLSYHLGFLPVDAVPDFVMALNDDPFLDDQSRGAVRVVYESLKKTAHG